VKEGILKRCAGGIYEGELVLVVVRREGRSEGCTGYDAGP